ncbi:MAG TPA: hypothetical protein VGY66_12500 [Gemmataceae bacterium]|jgi:hypothetical protein|nr:hypothetical protein [Gemmataceae bacterium]
MERENFRQLLRGKPFQPFRIVVNDGRIFEVRHPEMNLLARSYVKIGVPESAGADPICDHTEFVPLSKIVGVEALPSAMPPLAS